MTTNEKEHLDELVTAYVRDSTAQGTHEFVKPKHDYCGIVGCGCDNCQATGCGQPRDAAIHRANDTRGTDLNVPDDLLDSHRAATPAEPDYDQRMFEKDTGTFVDKYETSAAASTEATPNDGVRMRLELTDSGIKQTILSGTEATEGETCKWDVRGAFISTACDQRFHAVPDFNIVKFCSFCGKVISHE